MKKILILVVGAICLTGCVRTSLIIVQGSYSPLGTSAIGGNVLKVTDFSDKIDGYKTTYIIDIIGKDIKINRQIEPVK